MSTAAVRLTVQKIPSGRSELAVTNFAYVSSETFRYLSQQAPAHIHGVVPGTLLCECKGLILNVKADGETSEGQLMLNNLHRDSRRIATKEDVVLKIFHAPKHQFTAGIVCCDVTAYIAQGSRLSVKDEDVIPLFKKHFCGQVCSKDQLLAIQWGASQALKLTVTKIIPLDALDSNDLEEKSIVHGLITASTQYRLAGADDGRVQVHSRGMQRVLFNSGINFEQLGIGGLDKEFAFIFRRAFVSRTFPPEVVAEVGIKHVRGMLLYGPPGTGKTLIARQIAKALHAVTPKIVNGPEVLNKYVGQSEENIRNLFKDAEVDQEKHGDNSPLHTIIFDEIDAICKRRGTATASAGVNDSIVNQLLSKIDGVNALNNVLLIGMTNRRDLIDDALLRPGRLEVHVEIGLPDESGRLQILSIHTSALRKSNRLATDVSLVELAAATKNFTGAELEALVRTATTCAMSKKSKWDDMSKPVDTQSMTVTRNDFDQALQEVEPQLGSDDSGFDSALVNGIISFGDKFDSLVEKCQTLTRSVTEGPDGVRSILLLGAPGSGKTALAAHIAKCADFPFMKIVSPESFAAYGEMDRAYELSKVFDDAQKSELSLVLLDDLETLVDYNRIGSRFSNVLLRAIRVLVRKRPKAGRRLVVIGTSSKETFMQDSELADAFDFQLFMPSLDEASQFEAVFKARHLQHSDFPPEEMAQVLRDHRLIQPIGIKQLILAIQWAADVCLPGHITYKSFKECHQDVACRLTA